MHKTALILLGSLLLGLSFNFLFFGKAPGVSFFLFVVLTFAVSAGLAHIVRKPIPVTVLVLGAASLFFTVMAFMRASAFLVFLNIVMVIGLALLMTDILASPKLLRRYTIAHYVETVCLLPLTVVRHIGSFVPMFIEDGTALGQHRQKIIPVLRGLLIGLPFLLVFALLFSAADSVFRHDLARLFNLHIPSDIVARLVIIVIVAMLYVGAFTLLFLPVIPKLNHRLQNSAQSLALGVVEAYVILGSVAVLFATFVLIQITYLFGGQHRVLTGGISYADYARNGFFELIVVAALSLALILGVNGLTSRTTKHHIKLFKWLNIIVIIEVAVIMVSAVKRLGLYEQAYGFTSLRLYSHMSIVWLAVIFILLVINIMREQTANQFAFQVFISVLAALAIVNFINPEAIVAHQNIQRFQNIHKLDPTYLSTLSSDATPTISQAALKAKDVKVRGTLAQQLYLQEQHMPKHRHWQSFNVSQQHAQQIYKQNLRLLDANQHFLKLPTIQALDV